MERRGGGRAAASTKAWHALLQAVAAGWDRNLRERSAKLDLDAYAMELEQAERKRIDVRSCFGAFMDALVQDYSAHGGSLGAPPAFRTTAVDDADMNPRALRSISWPCLPG